MYIVSYIKERQEMRGARSDGLYIYIYCVIIDLIIILIIMFKIYTIIISKIYIYIIINYYLFLKIVFYSFFNKSLIFIINY